MSRLIDLTSNAEELAGAVRLLGERITGADAKLASEAFKDVRDLLMQNLRDNWSSRNFAPLSPVTVEYKKRKGLDPRTLFASGASFAGIDGRYGTSWAKALRGETEWWMFLHDKGVGVAHWSREGDARQSAAKNRRHRNRKQFSEGRIPLTQFGLTRFPARPVFYITDSTRSAVLDRIELFLQTACDEVGNASA